MAALEAEERAFVPPLALLLDLSVSPIRKQSSLFQFHTEAILHLSVSNGNQLENP